MEIIPVIHMLNEKQVFANVDTCLDCDIKKIFLINHQVMNEELLHTAFQVKKQHSKLWVGINLLGLSTKESLNLDIPVDGMWCDETISEKEANCRKFQGIFFGGIAFKYQPQPKSLEEACLEITKVAEVATTSGEATGKAPSFEKIQTLRKYLGNHPLAIASGISVENIKNYAGLVDYVLVASSITDKNEMIIKEKLKALKASNED